jgi:hypothetical protein
MKKCIFILLLLNLKQFVFAQKNKPVKPTKEVIHFDNNKDTLNPDNIDLSLQNESKFEYKKSILKTSPFSLIIGKAIFEYEKEIKDYLSIQGGIGFTFSPTINPDFEKFLGSDEKKQENIWINNDLYDDQLDKKARNYKLGFIGSISSRFFFESDGFEGNYISPKIQYTRFNVGVQPVKEILNTSGIISDRIPNEFTFEEHFQTIDFSIQYGIQKLYPKLTAEYFIGLGIRSVSLIRQDIGIDEMGIQRNGAYTESGSKFLIEIGVRVGFQL